MEILKRWKSPIVLRIIAQGWAIKFGPQFMDIVTGRVNIPGGVKMCKGAH